MIKTAKSSPNAKNVVDEKETEAKADTKNVVDEETEAKADTYEKEYPKLEVEKLEQIRAKEYSEKSNDERESLLNELHGVSSRAVPENPEMIHAALLLFQLELDKCSLEHEKRAYLRACSMKSTYVHSVGFRLKFLRAEFFHVQNATLRYLQNLNYMLDKFGEIALMRQLYMSDLNNEDIRFLKKGYMQILPFRDRAGRRILASLGSLGGFEYSMETKERVAIYICHAILSEDVVSQRKGAVMLGLLNEEAIESIRMIKMPWCCS
ncbi:unnamed protein product [Pseudo-nitzschia multistriata]|uniref:Uncharacterized protein n=1 Tax=Pseudo-nitzschia multistriata TaxID=183589 RepID=A0A448ZI60_9STRA|nr:unnamed protein product [Pseudo-nitzschia multistriata]